MSNKTRRFLLCILGFIPTVLLGAVPEDLNRILKKSRADLGGLSFYVSRVDAAKPWLAYQDRVLRNPASVIKVLTTAVALEKFGPAYTWKTEFYGEQAPKAGHIRGPIYIKGYGDPYVTVERFWAMIQELRQVGIQHIHGDVILDASYFGIPATEAQDFDGQESRAYNVPPYALLVNFQSLRLRFTFAANSVDIQSFPEISSIKIVNQLRLTQGPCGAWKSKIKIDSLVQAHQEQLVIAGRYPKSCGEQSIYRAVLDPAKYTAGLFISLWRQQGGTISGLTRTGRVPKNAKLLLSVPSLPLAEIIRGINKFSNNVMTRHLLLTVIAESLALPANETHGELLVKRWLDAQQIPTDGFRLENGAGLSRSTRISAFQLGQVLKTVYQKPYMPELVSSLPITGVDGTFANRELAAETYGRMHLKTGFLDNVRATAGYFLNAKGQRYVIVILHNHASATTKQGLDLQDRIINWVYKHSP